MVLKKMDPRGSSAFKMLFEGENQQEIGKWTELLIILKKENGPRGSSSPALGLNTIIFKYMYVYWYMKQISGEHLQDHWSSGFVVVFLMKLCGIPTLVKL